MRDKISTATKAYYSIKLLANPITNCNRLMNREKSRQL